jgi:hypothetical protein
MEERKRLLVYGLLSGYLAGLLYVLTFIAQGLVMDPPDMFGMLAIMGSLMGDILGITDKMMIVMIGVMFHEVIGGTLLGLLFGALLIVVKGNFPINNKRKMIIIGLIYGVIIFMIGPMMMVPMMMGGPLFDLSLVNMVSAIGHLFWGAIMGYIVYFFDNRGYFK